FVTPRGHSSNGLSGAKSSMLKKPETSVPSSGLPSCDSTVVTSGCLPTISRMRLTYFADCSSEMDIGSVARIQRFPSSSVGMNSRPRNGEEEAAGQDGHQGKGEKDFRVTHGPLRGRAVETVEELHHHVLLAGDAFEEDTGQYGSEREREENGAADGKGVGAGHRREDDPFDAGHGEERQEGHGDDDRGEENRSGHFDRGVQDAFTHRMPVLPRGVM